MLIANIFMTVFPVLAVVAAGAAYGRWKRPDMALTNQLNMDVFVPALVFSVLADKSFSITAYQSLAIGATIVVLGSGLLLLPLARLARVDLRTFLPPMMFNNTGNMGIPLIVLAFGEEALPAAVLLFIIEMILHFSVGMYILDHRTRLIRLLQMPIIQATILGLVFSLLGWSLPKALAIPLDMVGQISIPLMLFALGVRLLSVDLRDWRLGLMGAVLCPLSGLAMVWLAQPWLQLEPWQFKILLVFGALPPAVLNYIMAEEFRQEPSRVASIVLLGNFASLVSIPAVLAYVL